VTAAKPLPGFEERWSDVKAVRMRTLVAGEGEPVVLLHGLSGAASNWVELAPALARRRRVLVPELPGHGGSSPLPATPNLDVYAERVRLALRAEGVERADVVGHSLGGVVALRLALRHPEAVRGLVLAGAAGIASATRRAEFWINVFGVTRPGRLVAPLRGLLARRPRTRGPVFARWQVADPLSLSGESVRGFLEGTVLHTDALSAGRALVRDDPRLDLDRVRCPVLVLWGARDLQVPVQDAFEYARRLRAELRVIADCGHLLIGERPAACLDAVESFLDRVGEVDELPLEPELGR
jgi:pimeloyl-ACP methyl ester carboxylesterase